MPSSIVLNGTTGIANATWTTGTRPASPVAGQSGYNTTIGAMETYTGSTWSTSDLPAVGASGNVLTSNGTSWASATPPSTTGGATTTSSAGNITLTSSSNRLQIVNLTTVNSSVTLPDATTLTSLGGPLFIIVNAGYLSINIKNGAGYNIFNLQPGGSMSFNLSDNSTVAGTWSSEDTSLELASTDFTTVTSSYVNNSGYSWLENNFGISSDTISSTSAIVTWSQGTSGRDIYGAVVSYSGTTITVGTATLIYSGSSTAASTNMVKMLSSTNGLVFVQRASDAVCVPFTLSGTTITVGTTSSTFGAATVSGQACFGSFVATSSTAGVISYRTNATANYTFVINTVTHNGSSAPTFGTASATVVTTAKSYGAPILSKIDATTIFVAYAALTTEYPVARIATLSGTSAPTLGTANTTSTTNYTNDGIGYLVYQASSTQFVLIAGLGSIYYTVSGTTVTYGGASLYSTFSTNTIGNAYPCKYVYLGTNLVGNQYGGGNLLLGKLSSTVLYLKTSVQLSQSFTENLGSGSGFTSTLTALDSTTAFGFTVPGTGIISATVIKYIGV